MAKPTLAPIARILAARRWWWAAPLLAPGLASANPTGADVVSGTVGISTPDANTLRIDQGSQAAAINWQSFSIEGNEYVVFNQPTASAVVLNRVVGGSVSEIFGSLQANGRVFLINPQGILFGVGSRVDVGGLVASTLDISDEDFQSGRYLFSGTSTAGVANAGQITAGPGGFVVLAGDHVSTSGLIQAQLGSVLLASGSAVTLDLAGDGLISYAIDQAAFSDRAGVENLGQIIADGGRVVMAANVARSLAATVVNNQGLVQAQSIIEGENGEIVLTGAGGDVVNAGTLDVSGTAAAPDAGTVSVTGDRDVTLAAGSRILAAPAEGGEGGDVRAIAGGHLTYERGAHIAVGNALTQGGFVELSGHTLAVRDIVALGRGGTLLFDPPTFTVGASVDGSSGITETTLENQLRATPTGGRIIIAASQQIFVNDIADDSIDGRNPDPDYGGGLLLGIGSYVGNSFFNGSGQGYGDILFTDVNDAIRVEGDLSLIGGFSYGDIIAGHLDADGQLTVDAHDNVQTQSLQAGRGGMVVHASVGSVTINGDVAADIVPNGTLPDGGVDIDAYGDILINGNVRVTGTNATGTLLVTSQTGDVQITRDINVSGYGADGPSITAGATVDIFTDVGNVTIGSNGQYGNITVAANEGTAFVNLQAGASFVGGSADLTVYGDITVTGGGGTFSYGFGLSQLDSAPNTVDLSLRAQRNVLVAGDISVDAAVVHIARNIGTPAGTGDFLFSYADNFHSEAHVDAGGYGVTLGNVNVHAYGGAQLDVHAFSGVTVGEVTVRADDAQVNSYGSFQSGTNTGEHRFVGHGGDAEIRLFATSYGSFFNPVPGSRINAGPLSAVGPSANIEISGGDVTIARNPASAVAVTVAATGTQAEAYSSSNGYGSGFDINSGPAEFLIHAASDVAVLGRINVSGFGGPADEDYGQTFAFDGALVDIFSENGDITIGQNGQYGDVTVIATANAASLFLTAGSFFGTTSYADVTVYGDINVSGGGGENPFALSRFNLPEVANVDLVARGNVLVTGNLSADAAPVVSQNLSTFYGGSNFTSAYAGEAHIFIQAGNSAILGNATVTADYGDAHVHVFAPNINVGEINTTAGPASFMSYGTFTFSQGSNSAHSFVSREAEALIDLVDSSLIGAVVSGPITATGPQAFVNIRGGTVTINGGAAGDAITVAGTGGSFSGTNSFNGSVNTFDGDIGLGAVDISTYGDVRVLGDIAVSGYGDDSFGFGEVIVSEVAVSSFRSFSFRPAAEVNIFTQAGDVSIGSVEQIANISVAGQEGSAVLDVRAGGFSGTDSAADITVHGDITVVGGGGTFEEGNGRDPLPILADVFLSAGRNVTLNGDLTAEALAVHVSRNINEAPSPEYGDFLVDVADGSAAAAAVVIDAGYGVTVGNVTVTGVGEAELTVRGTGTLDLGTLTVSATPAQLVSYGSFQSTFSNGAFTSYGAHSFAGHGGDVKVGVFATSYGSSFGNPVPGSIVTTGPIVATGPAARVSVRGGNVTIARDAAGNAVTIAGSGGSVAGFNSFNGFRTSFSSNGGIGSLSVLAASDAAVLGGINVSGASGSFSYGGSYAQQATTTSIGFIPDAARVDIVTQVGDITVGENGQYGDITVSGADGAALLELISADFDASVADIVVYGDVAVTAVGGPARVDLDATGDLVTNNVTVAADALFASAQLRSGEDVIVNGNLVVTGTGASAHLGVFANEFGTTGLADITVNGAISVTGGGSSTSASVRDAYGNVILPTVASVLMAANGNITVTGDVNAVGIPAQILRDVSLATDGGGFFSDFASGSGGRAQVHIDADYGVSLGNLTVSAVGEANLMVRGTTTMNTGRVTVTATPAHLVSYGAFQNPISYGAHSFTGEGGEARAALFATSYGSSFGIPLAGSVINLGPTDVVGPIATLHVRGGDVTIAADESNNAIEVSGTGGFSYGTNSNNGSVSTFNRKSGLGNVDVSAASDVLVLGNIQVSGHGSDFQFADAARVAFRTNNGNIIIGNNGQLGRIAVTGMYGDADVFFIADGISGADYADLSIAGDITVSATEGSASLDLFAYGDITVPNVTVTASGSSASASFFANLGNVTTGNVTVSAYAGDASASFFAGGNVTTQNVFVTASGSSFASASADFFADGNITTGNVTAIAYGSSAEADFFAGGNITVNGDVQVSAYGDDASVFMFADGGITVGNITAFATGTFGSASVDLFAGTDITTRNVTVTSESSSASASFFAGGNINLANLTVTGYGENFTDLFAGGNITVGNVTIANFGSSASLDFYAGGNIQTGNVTMTVTGSSADARFSAGGNIMVNGSLLVQGTSASADVFAGGDITLQSVTVTGDSDRADLSIGAGGNLNISGNVTVSGYGSADANLSAGNNLTIAGALTVAATPIPRLFTGGFGTPGDGDFSFFFFSSSQASAHATLDAGYGVSVGNINVTGAGNVGLTVSGSTTLTAGTISVMAEPAHRLSYGSHSRTFGTTGGGTITSFGERFSENTSGFVNVGLFATSYGTSFGSPVPGSVINIPSITVNGADPRLRIVGDTVTVAGATQVAAAGTSFLSYGSNNGTPFFSSSVGGGGLITALAGSVLSLGNVSLSAGSYANAAVGLGAISGAITAGNLDVHAAYGDAALFVGAYGDIAVGDVTVKTSGSGATVDFATSYGDITTGNLSVDPPAYGSLDMEAYGDISVRNLAVVAGNPSAFIFAGGTFNVAGSVTLGNAFVQASVIHFGSSLNATTSRTISVLTSQLSANAIGMAADTVIDLTGTTLSVGSAAAPFGANASVQEAIAQLPVEVQPTSRVPNLALSAPTVKVGSLSLSGDYVYIQSNVLSYDGFIDAPAHVLVHYQTFTSDASIGIEQNAGTAHAVNYGVAQHFNVYPGTTFVFGDTSAGNPVSIGETGTVDVGGRATNFFFLSANPDLIQGDEKIVTAGLVKVISPFVAPPPIPQQEEVSPDPTTETFNVASEYNPDVDSTPTEYQEYQMAAEAEDEAAAEEAAAEPAAGAAEEEEEEEKEEAAAEEVTEEEAGDVEEQSSQDVALECK